ncbi:GPW/gp25 family protein [Streptomyces sp. NPDC054884]|uniref:GPW/gp25 family protein n=1 Tax=unclassified Streptomyces TaxID=2593676 RepID=UPI0029B051FC|nr:GPW/gp25 family protein [Streptomyces sp. ME08-AFT2]MDX3310063.1 GPW/gp25 family protein [Streptomyces sp. ME08-AFT2]
MDVDFPYRPDACGRTARTGHADHVRDMVELVLFTSPGERVNRPDFGCSLLDLVFTGNSPELAATVQMTAQAALQRWLGDLLQVDSVTVTSEEATLRVAVAYTLTATGERHAVTVTGGGNPS